MISCNKDPIHVLQSVGNYEDSQMSDTTASAPGSDDEIGSNAATDGSTLRTSPADHGGSGGSESGGSAEESISGEHNGKLGSLIVSLISFSLPKSVGEIELPIVSGRVCNNIG